ncbi:ATP-dependent zinc protease [Nitrosococcus wardiae]|uniref:ATP-dependent zinc protease n=1 Tax=Nitrosococcus wardiae TaxID=1814290 RepID=A0A4P7C299_9GAMM|nr:ATP-dependent zinc protease [Nitrosococcus wardiae]QBQ55634.1 ATP-dependent zinc protease [Nitrosococcus wardiae]
MQRFGGVIVFWLLALGGVSEAANSGSEGVGAKERIIMGWVERVALIPWGAELKAKLDSGAKTSSLHAEDIERFEKDGEEWVRFIIELEGKGEEMEQLHVEQPLVRNVRIKRHKGNAKRRPVVNLKFCLNGRSYETQFSLVDRSQLNYPLLLGRRFLKDVALIDPSKTFLTNEGWDACLIKYAADEASDQKAEIRQN